jgi:hypothetical protein
LWRNTTAVTIDITTAVVIALWLGMFRGGGFVGASAGSDSPLTVQLV